MKENRNLLIGILLGALIAGIPGLLCINSWSKRHMKYQQIQIAQQASLIESTRIGGLVILMSNVLEKMEAELQENPKRVLRDETIARIAALCYSFKPYTSPEGDSLSTKKLSPERGHLLLVISRTEMDSGSLYKILTEATFSGADLREADLSGTDLSGADLRKADLSGANLQGTNLDGANLSFANLWGANLSQASLKGANLKRADLKWADLNGSDLTKADLTEADLTSAQLRKVDLRGSILRWADFSGAFLNEADFTGADMFRTTMRRAQLAGSILSETNLTLAILCEANLVKANLTGADVTDLYVSEENWQILLNEWLVSGAKELQDGYKIVDLSADGKALYQLKKIEN